MKSSLRMLALVISLVLVGSAVASAGYQTICRFQCWYDDNYNVYWYQVVTTYSNCCDFNGLRCPNGTERHAPDTTTWTSSQGWVLMCP